jgi:hypothetical protein
VAAREQRRHDHRGVPLGAADQAPGVEDEEDVQDAPSHSRRDRHQGLVTRGTLA